MGSRGRGRKEGRLPEGNLPREQRYSTRVPPGGRCVKRRARHRARGVPEKQPGYSLAEGPYLLLPPASWGPVGGSILLYWCRVYCYSVMTTTIRGRGYRRVGVATKRDFGPRAQRMKKA